MPSEKPYRMSRGDFESLLKDSQFFYDVMNTHRVATAQILAEFLSKIAESGKLSIEELLSTLSQLEKRTDSPSNDGERSYIVAAIRHAMQQD